MYRILVPWGIMTGLKNLLASFETRVSPRRPPHVLRDFFLFGDELLSSVVDALVATNRDATVVDMEDARDGGSGGGNPPPPSRALPTLPHDSSSSQASR